MCAMTQSTREHQEAPTHFAECPKCELRRILILRRWVNKEGELLSLGLLGRFGLACDTRCRSCPAPSFPATTSLRLRWGAPSPALHYPYLGVCGPPRRT